MLPIEVILIYTISQITHSVRNDFSTIFFDEDCDSEGIYICILIFRKSVNLFVFMMQYDIR